MYVFIVTLFFLHPSLLGPSFTVLSVQYFEIISSHILLVMFNTFTYPYMQCFNIQSIEKVFVSFYFWGCCHTYPNFKLRLLFGKHQLRKIWNLINKYFFFSAWITYCEIDYNKSNISNNDVKSIFPFLVQTRNYESSNF